MTDGKWHFPALPVLKGAGSNLLTVFQPTSVNMTGGMTGPSVDAAVGMASPDPD